MNSENQEFIFGIDSARYENLISGLDKLPVPTGVPDSLIKLAHDIAKDAHRNQKRRFNGDPYIVHPEAVAARLPDRLKPLGFLHDVLEDNPREYPIDRLIDLFPMWLTARIVMLSRRHDEEYDNYVLRIARDEAAKTVKIADLRHNLSDLRPGALRNSYRLALRVLGEKP